MTDPRVQKLIVALKTLRNETKGTLSAHEVAIRYDHGNSNWACLMRALEMADEALLSFTASEPSGDGVADNEEMKRVFAVHYQHRYKGEVDRFEVFALGWKAALRSSLPKETSAVGDGKNHPKVQAALMGVLDELSAMSPEEFDKALTTRDEGGGNGI